jgi:hypothetical protein
LSTSAIAQFLYFALCCTYISIPLSVFLFNHDSCLLNSLLPYLSPICLPLGSICVTLSTCLSLIQKYPPALWLNSTSEQHEYPGQAAITRVSNVKSKRNRLFLFSSYLAFSRVNPFKENRIMKFQCEINPNRKSLHSEEA